MDTILEVLFDLANRRLRRRGPLGVLVGLLLIVYVVIPVKTAEIQSALQSIGRTFTHNLQENQQRLRARGHRGAHAVR